MKASKIIRESVAVAQDRRIKIIQGAWFDFSATHVVGCDPIGAVLLHRAGVPRLAVPDLVTLMNPGYVALACKVLEVDIAWLRRFWLGFDRQFQVSIIHEDKTETLDDVSSFAIQLLKEIRGDNGAFAFGPDRIRLHLSKSKRVV